MSHLSGTLVGFINGVPVPTSVQYNGGVDPWALTFVFHNPEPNVWTFSKDLLIDGLEEPAGEGDVKFRPAGDNVILNLTGRNNVSVELSYMRVDIEAVAKIVMGMVPRGTEENFIDIDTELEIFFKEG